MQTSAPNFGSILKRPSNQIEPPKPLPVGTYLWVVQGQPKQDKSSKKGTEFTEWTLKCLAAQDDVDTEALDAALTRADGSKKALMDQTTRATFYHTEDSIWRMKKFLVDDLQIEEKDGDEPRSLEEMIPEAAGRQVLGTLRHEASEDGQSAYARLNSTAPVE